MPVDRRALTDGWQVAASRPDGDADAVELDWRDATVGAGGGLTAAGALGDHDGTGERDYDASDWWFRVRLRESPPAEDEEVVLSLGGLATIADVYLDGELVIHSESMYAAHELDLGGYLAPGRALELSICCRALQPRLAVRRKPRARWRTRVVAAPNLRFFRTMLLGRAPGFAPGPAVVGPWRPVAVERRAGLVCERVALRPRVSGSDGVLAVCGRLRAVGGGDLPESVRVSTPGGATELSVGSDGGFAGEHTVTDAELWWPHTHGEPVLHPAQISAGSQVLYDRRVGFRSLTTAADLQADGPDLHVNGVSVFCRGAVWTPPSLAKPDPGADALRPLLKRVADAGLNMLRIPGTGCYESDAFHDLCDELGILVWQDLMFANLDYPESDPQFMAAVEQEVRAEFARVAGRPSLAVVCGGSEVAQQVAMLGLNPDLADGPLYGDLLPRLLAEAGIEAPYVGSAPWGGALPFRPDRGVANYFGVGAYLRPLEDARRAEVRFASECLAFANIGDDDGADAVFGPAWKAGVPRDVGAGWDFDDVRDHYLRTVFAEDPAALRYADAPRYLALSRQLSGELMAETFGEWRRAASPCGGALVLWCKDLAPGAGWGLFDSRGEPKVALSVLSRALAPIAVWTTDEGLGGIAVHVANDRPQPLRARVRVAMYRDLARVEQGETELELPAHGAASLDAETVLGRFLDVGWAYRFGPPAADAVVVSLEGPDGRLISQAFRFPAGWPLQRRSAAELGLSALSRPDGEDRARVRIGADHRLAYGVRIEAPGWVPDDDAFCVEPGHAREIVMRRRDGGGQPGTLAGRVTALNLLGTVTIAPADLSSAG